MRIKTIQITKSKTVGIVANQGRTHFKKIQIMAQSEISEGDNPDKAYEELSQYIESKFEFEKNIK
jgi:hypothetical protein